MTDLPRALEPLVEKRRELLAILDLLDQETEPRARADLADELVGTCSQYEDVQDRVVYPALRTISREPQALVRAEADLETIRASLTDIRKRTQNVKPSDVHTSDPDGFERILDRLVEGIRQQLDHEDQILFPMLDEMEGPAEHQLRDAVQQAVAHASTHPHPPHNPIGRAVRGVVEKLNRSVHDQSTVSHPEIDQLHSDLETNTEAE